MPVLAVDLWAQRASQRIDDGVSWLYIALFVVPLAIAAAILFLLRSKKKQQNTQSAYRPVHAAQQITTSLTDSMRTKKWSG
jgi:hypothetical protein